MIQQKFAIGGSGSTYIYGLVDDLYRDNMTKDECKTFVKKGMYMCDMCGIWVYRGMCMYIYIYMHLPIAISLKPSIYH